jgi:hypothetical protein
MTARANQTVLSAVFLMALAMAALAACGSCGTDEEAESPIVADDDDSAGDDDDSAEAPANP